MTPLASSPSPDGAAPPYRRRRDVRYRVIDREAVVLRQEEGETLVLNEVGCRILQMADDGATGAEICAALVTEFEVEPRQAEDDVEHFIGQLIDAGVLESPDTGTSLKP